MMLFWVDDCIFYSKSDSSIDSLIKNIKEEFLLEKEEDMVEFLGLQIDRSKSRTVTLTQTGLMEIWYCNPKFTLADKVPLGKDIGGNPCRKHWEYRSVVGMMLYLLAGSTRPEISYDVR